MTIYKKFQAIAKKYPTNTAVTWKENQKWKSYDYKTFLEKVDLVASNLKSLGVEKGDRLAILSENRWEWLATDLAANKIGVISVPIHSVSSRDAIEYILKDSGSSYLFVSTAILEKHFEFLNGYEDLEEIIIFGLPGIKLDDFLLFRDLLNPCLSNDSEQINENDVSSIIYTSGTTGEPKGVMLSNKNFISDIEAVLKRVPVNSSDTFLSFLPLSHVLERTAGSYIPILSGAGIAYAENIKKLADNLGEIRPTLLISVPKIFEKMYEKIFVGIKERGGMTKKLFFWALQQKKIGWKKTLADKIIFSKIRKKVFGGRLRFAVSGGASINAKILRFFSGIGVRIIEGYGMTEASPIIAANSLEVNKVGTVGSVVDGVEIKIAPDKEILVKGDNVTKGYWNKAQATQETFADGSWLMTGDLGFLDSDGFLTIIGRKKEIIVTSNGKNIAPEKLEGVINLSQFIEQSLVVGHRRSSLAALLVPDRECVKRKFGEVDDLLLEKIMKEEIAKANTQLESYEQIRKIKILTEPFSVEAGELTSTLKIRRKIIENRYYREIEELYNK
jgi:long-chain acyl-CoA synthetase